MIEQKIAYDWALEKGFRILDYGTWDVDEFFTVPITSEEFVKNTTKHKCSLKPNSTPRKPDKYLEKRMFGLVMYNLSPIQQGIQFQHAVAAYSLKFKEAHDEWAENWMTSILYNGGTSCDPTEVYHGHRMIPYQGSMQYHMDALVEAGIDYALFKEPDANMATTAIVFLADERVFKDEELYPDFVETEKPWADKLKKNRDYKPSDDEYARWEKINDKNYKAWLEKIGGPKNEFLRTFRRQFRLA